MMSSVSYECPEIKVIRVFAPPDPLYLLACLSHLPGRFGLLTLVPPLENAPWRSFLGACPVELSSEWVPKGSKKTTNSWSFVPRWIGLLPYEATRCSLERPAWVPVERRSAPHHERPRWARYPAVLVVDHRSTEVFAVGEDASACKLLKRVAEQLPRAEPPPQVSAMPMEPLHLHRERIEAALELIRAGDIYQVNLARRLDVRLEGDGLSVFRTLVEAAPSPYAALLEIPGEASVYSTSPELFLSTQQRHVETWPIKGTRRRGRDAEEDQRLREALAADPKEQAELAMVIDLERNDLGKLAIPGSVQLLGPPEVISYRTLHHQVARVAADLLPSVNSSMLLEAMLPSGSVTGTPKVRAMEVIASLESTRRGLYTGALGYVSCDEELHLAIAIRTLTVQEGEGHYHSGGGIVADSNPAHEVEETQIKALQLTRMLRGEGKEL